MRPNGMVNVLISACKGKVRHTSAKRAKQSRSFMQKKYGVPFNVYRCRVCSGYHVGRVQNAES